MKKILFIASCDMYSTSGGGMANLVLWQALEERFPGSVDVLHPETDFKSSNGKFHYIPSLSKWQKFTHLLHGHIHRYTPWVLDFVDQHAGEYSHCVLNCGLFGDLVECLKKRGLKVCTIHHNFEAKYQKDNKRPCTLHGLTSLFVKKNERRAYLQSDENLFLTQYDAEQMGVVYGLNHAKNHVIGIFDKAEIKDIAFELTPLPENRLVISGGLNSVQSVEGLKQFFHDIIPSVDRYYQGVYNLLLAGRQPHSEIVGLSKIDNHVKLIANPTNMLSTIQDCGIYICPVSTGSGLKTRILDGLKLGMPIIVHKVSAQGYDQLWDKPWFQTYDDKASFLVALGRVVSVIKEHPNLRQEIKEAYQCFFPYEKGKERYVAAIDEFINM